MFHRCKRSTCLKSLYLISLSLMMVAHSSATLFPKARICFNSMVNSFQSECVFCDSRLYGSTLTACTGQPILANNITQAQAFCIATACLQQTGKNPVMLGRRKKRSLPFKIPLSALAINKQPIYGGQKQLSISGLGANSKPNGTLSAQLSNLANGTTSANLMFTLNRPAKATASAYIWSSPLARVLAQRSSAPAKGANSFQWQFGRAQTAAVAAPAGQSAAPPATPAAAPRPAAGTPPAAARPAAQPAASPPVPPAPAGPAASG